MVSTYALLFAGVSFATCPPIIGCKVTGEASTIAGSNADTELITFAQTITTDSNRIASAINDMAMSNAASISQGAQTIIASQMEMSQIQINQALTFSKAMADREMTHKAQLAENAYRSGNSVVSADDTKEEFQLILNYLDQYSDMSVPEIILILQETMDNDDELGYVMVPIKSSESACSEEDIQENGACSVAQRVFPARKMQSLYSQCSLEKRILTERKKKNEAKRTAVEITNRSTSRALENTSVAGSITQRLKSQTLLSCTPTEFKNNQCEAMSKEEYQEAIVAGAIIPNGDVSASNFLSPTAINSHGYINKSDLSPDIQDQVEGASLDRMALQNNPNQKIVKFHHTYRNANQVKAALSLIDNIVGDDLVPALQASKRRQASSAEYQSRFLNRIASLSMARLVLTESMSSRVGDQMRALINSGKLHKEDKFPITLESPDNKESVTGASALDILQDRVNRQTGSEQVPSANGSVNNDMITSPSETSAMDKILESLQLQNEMLLQERLMLEQTNSMAAISLAQKANSNRSVGVFRELRKNRSE